MKLMINEDHMTDEEILQALRAYFDGSTRIVAAGVIEGKVLDENKEIDVLLLASDGDVLERSYLYHDVVKALSDAGQVKVLEWSGVPV